MRPTNRQRLNNSVRLRGRDGTRRDAQRDAFSGGGLGDQTPEPLGERQAGMPGRTVGGSARLGGKLVELPESGCRHGPGSLNRRH